MNLAIENKRGDRIAKGTATAYTILCLLLLFTLKCEKNEEMSNMGVMVNLGYVDSGMNPDNIPTSDNQEIVEETSSQETVESASEAEIESATQDIVETNVNASENVSVKPANNMTNNATTTPQVVQETTPAPSVNQNAMFNGANNPNQGTGNTSGDQGNPDGNLESDIYGDIAGSGLGSDGKGWGLNGRGLISKPQPSNPTNEFGNVTVKITVDKFGTVIKAEFTSYNSTTTNSSLVQIAINEAYKVKFNNVASDNKARDKQVGYVVFKFKAQ
ncbi:MAG: hypothetical protein KDC82_03695 [Bacteroidetes bacterium]|nr:hypothetical protein [Bacteroidota bacterium]